MSSSFVPSEPTGLNSILLISFQAAWTGSPVGVIKLQASNDKVIWSDVSNSALNISGAGDVLYNLSEIGYLYIRIVYTKASGTGVLNIIANGKGV